MDEQTEKRNFTTEIYGEALPESIDYLEEKIRTTPVYQKTGQ